MIGWLADFFRLIGGLLYWNTRKSWFQLRRTRGATCPCQNLSDSGRALETQCEACMSWHRPARFKRVCPLLVDTPDGLRCSVDTAKVRPFWSIVAKYYGGTALAVYVIGVLTVFTFLRTIGYPVSIVHVGLPPLWHKVGQARGWFFLDRANKAFAAGKTQEGLLYLSNSYEFDPTNYAAGLALAKHLQAGYPARSDVVFQNLLKTHPELRHATAQDWYRALLPRGDFKAISTLARDELRADPVRGAGWMRALLFATRQLGDDAPLRELLADKTPAAAAWHRLIETELLLRAGNTTAARAAAERPQPAPAAANSPAHTFTLFHRVQTLIATRAFVPALDVLEQNRPALETDLYFRLRLEALAAGGYLTQLRREIDSTITSTRQVHGAVALICAHLIRHPDAQSFERVFNRVVREQLPFNGETAGTWMTLLCTAGVHGDNARLRALVKQLRDASPVPFVALTVVEAYFRGETIERRVTTFLPMLPLPLEVTYALIERLEPPAAPAVKLPTTP